MPSFRATRVAIVVALAVAGLVVIGVQLAPSIARRTLISAARRNGLSVSFESLRIGWGPSIRVSRLAVVRPTRGDTLVTADSLDLRIAWTSLLTGHPRPASVAIAHARVRARSRHTADPDTLSPAETRSRRRARRDGEDRSGRVRDTADGFVRALLVPARTLPALDLRDVSLVRSSEGEPDRGVRFERLTLHPERGGARLEATGTLALEQDVPFDGTLLYAGDDALTGRWTFRVPEPRDTTRWPMTLEIEGRVHQDRAARSVTILEPTRLRIGAIALGLSGRIARDGPSFQLAIAADSLSGARVRESLPPPTLGPLTGLATRGQWDYRASLDLDLARPDSVRFDADVIPRGLALDPAHGTLAIAGLDQPFTARIHLPRDRVVTRDLSPDNPHFLRLDELDPRVAAAVVTNEDGGFYRHRGFNTEAVKASIAENIRAGAFRRGAGTITMQLARNLWLGHERTLSRKGQEVVLAWALEHLTGLSKERLLEIYLNIIEWGPGVHGADEAARFYFDRGAKHLSVDEALFLAILVPSPSKWKWRLDERGELRPFAREQMHFIGRAMIAKGWLDPNDLPDVNALRIELRGAARSEFFPDPAPEETRSAAR